MGCSGGQAGFRSFFALNPRVCMGLGFRGSGPKTRAKTATRRPQLANDFRPTRNSVYLKSTRPGFSCFPPHFVPPPNDFRRCMKARKEVLFLADSIPPGLLGFLLAQIKVSSAPTFRRRLLYCLHPSPRSANKMERNRLNTIGVQTGSAFSRTRKTKANQDIVSQSINRGLFSHFGPDNNCATITGANCGKIAEIDASCFPPLSSAFLCFLRFPLLSSAFLCFPAPASSASSASLCFLCFPLLPASRLSSFLAATRERRGERNGCQMESLL